MSVLLFPQANALRLVLASGLAPEALARAPARGSVDEGGRIWLELPELPGRDVLAGLARVGVQVRNTASVATEPVRSWAELLPLRPRTAPRDGTVLFLGPDRAAARFVARLHRAAGGAVGVALRDSPEPRQAWVAARHVPARLLDEMVGDRTEFESFWEQAPHVWVRTGWEHPLPELLSLPSESLLLLRPPRGVSVAAAGIPACDSDELALPSVRLRSRAKPSRSPAVPVRFSLAARMNPQPETLWVLEDEAVAEFWDLCAAVDERLLRRLEVAAHTSGPRKRLVVRGAENSRPPTFLSLARTGYAPHAELPNLFLPANRELRPVVRTRTLAAVFGLSGDRLLWLEPARDGSIVPQSIARAEFQLLSELVEYSVPATVPLAAETRSDPFALERAVVLNEAQSVAELEPPLVITEEMEAPPAPAVEPAHEPAWYVRAWKKLLARRRREPDPPAVPVAIEETVETAGIADRRVHETLASPEALRHGPDWAARRRELEAALLQELPRLEADGRAARWATLASVYGKLGNPGDAAVCWLNAIWEAAIPPLQWLQQWLTMEYQAAKLTESERVLDRWLGERKPGIGRVVAAYATVAGHTQAAGEFLADLPRILVFLDQQFEDLPLRAAWLARLAAARVCDGDALGLARWHDRLLARLAGRGPGLDLDEPSFLRFHGSVSGERFQAARKCLESIHEKVPRWIERHARPGRKLPSDRLLQWAGILAEKEATGAYADFMLAWGIGALGERIQANTWAGRARKRLHAAVSGVDSAVHALLADLFLHRIKDAQEGRPPKPGLPHDLQQRLEALPDFPRHAVDPRYAVDRLRDHSRILEPLDGVRSYRGRDLKGLLGNDRLGERLYLLLDRTDPKLVAEEARTLVELCTEMPAAEVVPRIVLALLEVSAGFDATVPLRVLDHVPTALEWLEPWLATLRNPDARDRIGRVRTRIVKSAFTAAASLDPALVGDAVARLIQKLRQLGGPVRAALLDVAPHVFRSLRRLGLRGDAESLVLYLDPDRGGSDSPLTTRLGLAIGWLSAGNDDVGHRALNEAREKLYLDRDLDLHQRTNLALAYADALGFAPPGIAHGRLGELFERLDRVAVSGSTNRYFTLKPLQLVDTAVRAVVTDEFALGPAVRGWLDDDEFLIRGRIHRDLAAVLREQGIV